MSISMVVRVNGHQSIAVVEVQRTSHVDVDTLPADTVVAYEVRLFTRRDHDDANPLEQTRTAPIWHRYGDGPLVLIRTAVDAVLPAGAGA